MSAPQQQQNNRGLPGSPTQKRPDPFRRKVKRWLSDTDTSVTELARRVGHPRNTVSLAINQGKCPGVRAKISEAITA